MREAQASTWRSAIAGHAPPPGSDPFATPSELDPAERGDAEGRPEATPPAERQVEA